MGGLLGEKKIRILNVSIKEKSMKMKEMQEHQVNHNFYYRIEGGKLIEVDNKKNAISGVFKIKQKPLTKNQAMEIYTNRYSCSPAAAEYIDSILWPEDVKKEPKPKKKTTKKSPSKK